MDLENKTCLVTGSSRGIGKETVLKLAEKGADVVINYNSSEEAANTVKDMIGSKDGTALTVRADVSDYGDVNYMKQVVDEEFGGVNCLVNNAGITIDKKFDKMDVDDWKKVVEVNLDGMFNCTKVFYEDIVDSDCGRLINISSVVGQQGNYGQANYAATKSGMFGFTRTLALELADCNATANCVAPGFINTDMLNDVPERVQDKILEDIPLGRFGRPEEIANIVLFLVSDLSSYMTGQIIPVNGGMEW